MDARSVADAAVALGELKNPRALRLAAALERWLYRRARQITVVTRAFGAAIEAKGVPAAKLAWFPNGTQPELFGPDRVDPGLRARLGIAEDPTSHLRRLFGIAQARTSARLRRYRRTRIVFLLGDGPPRVMAARVAAQGLAGRVRLHPQVPPEAAAPYLNASDLLLVTLRRDPIFASFVPSTLFDCLACAPPVLLAVPGEARELLAESGGGLYAEPEDLELRRRHAGADPAAPAGWAKQGRFRAAPLWRRDDALVESVTASARAAQATLEEVEKRQRQPLPPLGEMSRSLPVQAVPAMSRWIQGAWSAKRCRNFPAEIAPPRRPPVLQTSATSLLISSS
jgi:glycosyltransferase involved in cell wall biosynthesis